MTSLLKKYQLDFILITLLLLFSPLFFYQLGGSSLNSWDEAWYAEIGKNIYKSGDFIHLIWNGKGFYDHPPTGFWLMATSYLFFGVSDYSTRFMSAFFGLGTMIVVYLFGKEIFSRIGGFFAAVSLPSAFWFLYRSRSGNLDIFLTFFFVLSLYLGFKSQKNKRFLIPFSISLSLLFLTKSIVPFTIIPALIVIFWRNNKLTIKDFRIPLLIFSFVVFGWFLVQIIENPHFISNYLKIGLPSVGIENNYIETIRLTKRYIYEGIGRWFWPCLLSLGLGLLFRSKPFFILATFWLVFTIPFIFSTRGGIWHLIPLHPIMLLSFFGFIDTFLRKIYIKPLLISAICFVFILTIGYPQIKRSWYEFIAVPAFISDEEILATEAGGYPNIPLYISGYDFRPAAVFYSGKEVPQQIYTGALGELFLSETPFLIIGYERELLPFVDQTKGILVLKKDRDKVLVLKK